MLKTNKICYFCLINQIQHKKEEKERELAEIIQEEKLKDTETRKLMNQTFKDGYVTTTEVAINKVLPPIPLFGKGNASREQKKEAVLDKLKAFFDKYFNI